jgi:hypothetical protein
MSKAFCFITDGITKYKWDIKQNINFKAIQSIFPESPGEVLVLNKVVLPVEILELNDENSELKEGMTYVVPVAR